MSATFASWLAEELTTAFKDYDDMELTIMDSKNELETQLTNMETCVSQNYDYVVLLPIQPAAEDDIVSGYIEDGTPFMMINLDDFGCQVVLYVYYLPQKDYDRLDDVVYGDVYINREHMKEANQ